MEQNKKESQEVPPELTKDFEKVLVYCPECEHQMFIEKKDLSFHLGLKNMFVLIVNIHGNNRSEK